MPINLEEILYGKIERARYFVCHFYGVQKCLPGEEHLMQLGNVKAATSYYVTKAVEIALDM
jgi:hypothetical protein